MKKTLVLSLIIICALSTYISYGADSEDISSSVLSDILEKVSDYSEGRKEVIIYYLKDTLEDEEGIDELKDTFSGLMSEEEKKALEARGISIDDINDSLDALKDWDKEDRMKLLDYVENGENDKVKEMILNDGKLEEETPEEDAGNVPSGGGGSIQPEDTTPQAQVVNEKPIQEETKISFKDIQNHWAKDSIINMVRLGITKGIDDENFGPEQLVTRSQMTAFIVRLLNIDITKESEIPFKDINKDSWDYDYVKAAYNTGIIKGVSDNKFNPEAKITREQMAVMIMNALNYKNIGLDLSQDLDLKAYKDAGRVSDWAKDSMAKLVYLELMKGKDKNMLDPTGNATRAEAITMIERVNNLINDK